MKTKEYPAFKQKNKKLLCTVLLRQRKRFDHIGQNQSQIGDLKRIFLQIKAQNIKLNLL